MAHTINQGVATGDQVQEIFNSPKEKGFLQLPAVNVIRSDTIKCCFRNCCQLNSPVIIQFSKWRSLNLMQGKGLV